MEFVGPDGPDGEETHPSGGPRRDVWTPKTDNFQPAQTIKNPSIELLLKRSHDRPQNLPGRGTWGDAAPQTFGACARLRVSILKAEPRWTPELTGESSVFDRFPAETAQWGLEWTSQDLSLIWKSVRPTPRPQRGLCRQKHRHRNADPKIGPTGDPLANLPALGVWGGGSPQGETRNIS